VLFWFLVVIASIVAEHLTPPSVMKFCPVVPEICRGQVHGALKERRIMIIIIRNGAKTIIQPYVWGFKRGGGYYRILWET
jgi:hypothetical protein